MRYVAYLCIEREVRTPVPRHFLAPLALCREAVELSESDVEQLPSEVRDRLRGRGEVTVPIDRCRALLHRISKLNPPPESYVKIVAVLD
ncbi:MAG: hypothetical protein GXO32_00350 [Crenarchaeota archaeon]|nr:hypothetical protein [Thermoproteota archaeon]